MVNLRRGSWPIRNLHVYVMGHGGALVETTPFDRRVVDSNPALTVI